MGFLFTDVYVKAVSLFDDPKITAAYNSNAIQFNKLMYTYLQNAIGLFNNPLSISIRLSNYKEPKGTAQVFEGDGTTKSFQLDPDFEILENSLYEYIEGKLTVKGKLNIETRTVEFPDVLPEGQQYYFQQYYPGEFLDDFKNFNQRTNQQGNNMIIDQIKNILARLLVKSWAEEERNFLLDIRNLMQDSDFKINGNDRVLKAKNEWIETLNSEVLYYQNRLAWMIRFMGGSYNIGRG